MKKVLLVVFTFVISQSFHSCAESNMIRGNGITSEKVIAVSDSYSELKVSGGIAVFLSPEANGQATIIADQMVMEYVSVTESDGKLTVSYKPHINVTSAIKTSVTLPVSGRISVIYVSSASTVHADNIISSAEIKIDCSSAGKVRAAIEARQFTAEVSSAAECNIDVNAGMCRISTSSASKYSGRLDVGNLTVGMSSASSCNLEGECTQMSIKASSASSFNGFGLNAVKASIYASSSGSADIRVIDELGVSLSSAASVRYKGSPKITLQDISSGASLKSVD